MAEQKLLDQIRSQMTMKHYSPKTIDSYVGWMKRYILFNQKRHPRELREREVEAFLNALANRQHVSASTQNQAFNAMLYLYREVLHIELEDVDALRARKAKRVPVVFAVDEVSRVLVNLNGPVKLAAMLMYGSGLRLMEAMSLRVKDVDFGQMTITVHDGKGFKDRTTLLPKSLIEPLRQQIEVVKAVHAADMARGFGGSTFPDALSRKYPNAPRELAWQYLLPADHLIGSYDGHSLVRHHLHESVTQKAVRAAIQRAGIYKHAGCHTFRHSFATHALHNGMDIRTLQTLMGHTDVRTTMGYLHVDINAGTGDRSPLDAL
jgi:integron integrase